MPLRDAMAVLLPLMVTGPGVAGGRTIEEFVESVGLNPSFAGLRGAAGHLSGGADR